MVGIVNARSLMSRCNGNYEEEADLNQYQTKVSD
jgi:hypothetical protein